MVTFDLLMRSIKAENTTCLLCKNPQSVSFFCPQSASGTSEESRKGSKKLKKKTFNLWFPDICIPSESQIPATSQLFP